MHPNHVTIIGVFVTSVTNTPIIFWARAGPQNAPRDHMRAQPPRLGTYMDIQRSAGGTSCPTTRVGGLARGTLGALANIGGWMAGWLEIAYKISCPAHPASQQPDCLAGQICRQPASQPAATPTTPPSSQWRPCATPPRGRLVGLGEPRMGWTEPPGHPGPGQLALTGRGWRGGGSMQPYF